VTAGTATLAQANRAKRQREVITDDDQRIGGAALIPGNQTTNGFAAKIHEGLRLNQLHSLVLD
jgi:hypothetical protein